MTQRDVHLTSADSELLEECRMMLPTGTDLECHGKYGFVVRPQREADGRRGSPSLAGGVWTSLELMGRGSSSKFVPEPYLYAGISDRLALLQGLMDTDGSVSHKDNHVEFTSASDDLAEAVEFLVRSLGGVARMRYKAKPTYTYNGEKRIGKPAYRVSIVMPEQYNPFRLSRKADAYRGRVKYPPVRAIVDVIPAGRV